MPIKALITALALSAAAIPARSEDDPGLSAAEIAAETQRIWADRANFAIDSDETYGAYRLRISALITNDGKYVTSISYLDRGDHPIATWRSNGAIESLEQFDVEPGDGPATLRQISINEAVPNELSYDGPMSYALFSILPGSRPVSTHLKEGGTIRRIEGSDRYLLESKTRSGTRPLVCELDPGRDWLATSVVSGDGTTQPDFSFEVTEFGQDNGRWVPIRGEGTQVSVDGEPEPIRFEVRSHRVNAEVEDSAFRRRLDDLPAGTFVDDEVNGTRYRVRGS